RRPGGRAAHDRAARRLFYFGMTRARDRLTLCHAADYGGKRTAKPSQFVIEAPDLPSLPRAVRDASAFEAITRWAPGAEPPAAEILPTPEDQPVEVSHKRIDDYLTCPLKYRYAHVAQVPLGTDPQAMYGIAIHHALRVYHQHRMRNLPITAAEVIAAFEGAWSSEGFFSREHEELRLEEGRRSLARFVARESAAARVPLATERDFRFKLGPYDTVAGRWDRIDEHEGGIVLVDYKTSQIPSREKADERTRKSVTDEQLGLY